MAKGQRRSNREHRKPKKEKAPTTPESLLGNQVKQTTTTAPGGKPRNAR
jgi:hypothetical protein